MTTAEGLEKVLRKVQENAKEKEAPRNGALRSSKRLVIAILTPTLGQVSMWWTNAVMQIAWPMNVGKAFMPGIDRVGGEVAEMRNRLVTLALSFEQQEGVELHSIFWLDDDVIPHKTVMLRLASHDRDIAAGVYFSKNDALAEPLIFDGPACGVRPFVPDTTLEAYGYAQGLSLVKKDVFIRMRDELDLGKDRYGNPQWFKVPDFHVDPQTGGLCTGGTEDFHFFENAMKLGYRPLVDTSRYAFAFHYDAKSQQGFPATQWEQNVRNEAIVWAETAHHKEVVWA